ncbi:MAG: lysophospholipid acyltransferase family protein [Alphaproteobacteria bacterium]|nr:lysophospholipid acyltransferase family protein [Alphaproteobacteria bacterium]
MSPPTIDTFSYAAPGDPALKRLVIRLVERLTGQPHLKRMYLENQENPRAGETFWDAAVRHLRLHLHLSGETLDAWPRKGPLIVIANHPFGVLDGILISHLVHKVRPDFKILTNAVLNRAPEVRDWLLPIEFAETKEALAGNLKSRAAARDHLLAGGCVVVFPAGGISTSRHPLYGKAVDADWGTFTAGLVHQAKADIAPVFFAGQNSRLFQIASHMSMTLRLSLIFKEVHDRIGSQMAIRIGRVIPYKDLAAIKDRKAMMRMLRHRTYALSGDRRLLLNEDESIGAVTTSTDPAHGAT